MKPTTLDELQHKHMLEVEELNYHIWRLRDALKEIKDLTCCPIAREWSDAALKIKSRNIYIDS